MIRPTGLLALFWVMRGALNSNGGADARPFWKAGLRWNRPRRKRRGR